MGNWRSLDACQRSLIRAINASPVVLLSLIFTWCYWAFNVRLCGTLLKEGFIAQGCLYLLFFQPVFILCVWSFWKVTRTAPGYTLDLQKPADMDETDDLCDDHEDVQLLRHHGDGSDVETGRDNSAYDNNDETRQRSPGVAVLNVEATESSISLNRHSFSGSSSGNSHSYTSITVKRDGAIRFCQKCNLQKYDRTHHCRSCKRCVLKMDHHCPWINNCVGFYNYKHFYLFLVYASFLCIYIFSTVLPPTIRVANGPLSILGLDFNWPFMVFVSAIFGLFLVPFTLFHTQQLFKNRTTIEYYEKANYRLGRGERDVMRSKYFNPWDLGSRKNFEQVMGINPLTWFLPVNLPQGNGRQFQLSRYAYDTLVSED